MATDVKLPRLGQGMESGTIVRWLKAEGDTVKKSEPLYELDTDKVTQEVESDLDGVLLKIVVKEGEVEVGTTIAVIDGGGGESPPAAGRADGSAAGPSRRLPSEPPAAPPVTGCRPPRRLAAATVRPPGRSRCPPGGRIKASPLARRIARERGRRPRRRLPARDPTGGSSPRTSSAPPSQAAPAPAARSRTPCRRTSRSSRMTSTRKTIARRLTEAWAAPVFQLGVSIDMTEALHLREQLVARLAEGEVKPTVNDLLTRFVGVALVRNRAVNATFAGDEIHRHPSAHVGIAVAAPNGLVVPVIRDADRRSVQEIARARADLVGRARDGKLTREDMDGGTFTISNLGMFGVDSSSPCSTRPRWRFSPSAPSSRRPSSSRARSTWRR